MLPIFSPCQTRFHLIRVITTLLVGLHCVRYIVPVFHHEMFVKLRIQFP